MPILTLLRASVLAIKTRHQLEAEMPKHTGSAQMSILISKHAARRMAQRSISNRDAEALLWYGDAAPAGRGASLLKIGENAARDLLQEGFRPTDIDRLRRLQAILSSDGTVVTLMHCYARPRRRGQRLLGATA